MSRIAKQPILLDKDVELTFADHMITTKGKLGSITFELHPSVEVKHEGDQLLVVPKDGIDKARAMAGTMRAILNNIVYGVSNGYEKKLTLVGVGYRAQTQGDKLNLTLGFSHPVVFDIPQGITIETPSQTEILIKGIDKQLVGQVAANIRRYRPPEPYKGKGIRFSDERIVLKEAKKK
jgi:large subunit ribosomal protein L6